MRFFDTPVISGTTAEEKLRQIEDFLFLQTETLNYNLGQQTPEAVFRQAQAAMNTAQAKAAGEAVKANYKAFRDLIVGTADLAIHESDAWQQVLREVYHAESRFGTFTEQIETQLRATAAAIEQNTSYIGQVNTALNSYTLRQQNFIKTGILENTGASPVFGIDVGLLLQSYTEDDTTFSVTRPKKLRITPEKLSFFDDDTEVAYITSGAIHFPNAVITGGSINIGRRQDGSYNFSVTNEGVLTAKSGTFSGNINGGSININNNFAVTSTGLMTANNAVISDQSWIGKWYVGDFLYYHSNPNGQGDAVTAYFGSGGALIGNNLFWVDGNGEGYFKSDLTVGGDLDVTDIRATGELTVNSLYGISSGGVGTFSGLNVNGSVSFGTVSGMSGSFSGAVSGTTGTFSSTLSGESLKIGSTTCIDGSRNGSFRSLTVNSSYGISYTGAGTLDSLTVNSSYGISRLGVGSFSELSLDTFGYTLNLYDRDLKDTYDNYNNRQNGKIKIDGLLIQWGKIAFYVENNASDVTQNLTVRFQEAYKTYTGTDQTKSYPMMYASVDTTQPSWYIVSVSSSSTNTGMVYLTKKANKTYEGWLGVHWLAIGEAATQ